jgi:hypothetical protein
MFTLVSAACVCAACGSDPPNPSNPRYGPNYSTVPCPDNCGGDVQCMNRCSSPQFRPPAPGVPPDVH